MKTTGSRPNLRTIQAAERQVQILDTALAVFAEKGFANATINDIAGAAGISSGLMYHYFSGKKKLLEAIIARHSFLPQLKEIIKNNEDRHYREVLKTIALGFIDLLEKKDKIVRIFLQEGFSNKKVGQVWSSMANEGVLLLKEYITARISAGEFRVHNAEVTARCLFSILVMYHLTRNVFHMSKIAKIQFVESMLDNLLSGIESSRA